MIAQNSLCKKVLLLPLICIGYFSSLAQISPNDLQTFLADDKQLCANNCAFFADVNSFYKGNNYQMVWLRNAKNSEIAKLQSLFKLSTGLGLQENDYQGEILQAFTNGTIQLSSKNDSLATECQLTDAVIHFLNDVAYGNIKPNFDFDGLKYKPDCWDIPTLLFSHLNKNTLPQLVSLLTPRLPEMLPIIKRMNWFQKIMADNHFEEVSITNLKVKADNKPLINKLFQLGILDSIDFKISDTNLSKKVIEAQRQFSLLVDGSLHKTFLQEINVPIAIRLRQLIVSLNYYRWLNCLVQNKQVIVVNLPATYLKVYNKNAIALEMRLIVGKTSTPTPTLTSSLKEVVLYPYWRVPYKIATREILPILKRNPNYINTGNYQVLNNEGEILDSNTVINWHRYSRNYFPFVLRQSTGCDNALGLLKLNFYNPFDVYLHDTPGKILFSLNKRFFSHGCMRMEKPMELGHLVLPNNAIAIDTLEQKGCLRNQAPIIVPAEEHMPVIVWYNPSGVDQFGRVLFFADVYDKFDWMKSK
jgi:L,D-transpeptidase YcbB